MDAPEFRAVAQSLLQDSTFADFTIRCAGKEYKVHRQIIACHSQAFREYFKIKVEDGLTSDVVELNSDSPEIMDIMINYFYKFDYENNLATLSLFQDSLELHASIYAIAEKYGVPDLKNLAMTKFCEDATTAIAYRHNPLPAIGIIYSSTPDIDRGLRDVAIEFWSVASGAVIRQQGRITVNRFMFDNPAFASDLAMNYDSKRSFPPDDCSCVEGQGNGFGPVDIVIKEKMCLYCRRPLSWRTRLCIAASWC